MFAFIELNPVRAGLYDDPKDYRYCGYAEALAKGSLLARQGIRTILGQPPLTGAGGDARRTFFLLRGSRSPSSPLLCDLSLFRYSEFIKRLCISRTVAFRKLRNSVSAEPGVTLSDSDQHGKLRYSSRQHRRRRWSTRRALCKIPIREFKKRFLRVVREICKGSEEIIRVGLLTVKRSG
jgi:hypothetical protein